MISVAIFFMVLIVIGPAFWVCATLHEIHLDLKRIADLIERPVTVTMKVEREGEPEERDADARLSATASELYKVVKMAHEYASLDLEPDSTYKKKLFDVLAKVDGQ